MRVSAGSDVSSAPSIEQSVMIFGRGRGRGHGCDFGRPERRFVRGGHESYGQTECL